MTGRLNTNGIRIGMDGKGGYRDNVFGERRWELVKYEEAYLRADEAVSQAWPDWRSILRFIIHAGRRPALIA